MLNDKKFSYRVLVFVSGIAAVLANFLVLLLFRSSAVSPAQLAARIGLPGIVFVVIYNVLLGRTAAYFGAGFFQNSAGDGYINHLKKLGSVPLKNIVYVVILQLVFLGALFFRNEYIGIEPAIKGPLFLAALSLGMVVGTFVYLLTDSLVSRSLILNNLTGYPRDLREERQSVKFFIIPMAVVIVSLCFASSAVILVISKSGGALAGMSGGVWFQLILIMAVFFLSICAMAFALKKNTGLLFDLVITQLENLSSEQKDLTKRISICSVDELGTIAGMVNSFCENMSGGVREIKTGQRELSASGLELKNHASGMAASISQVSRGVEQVHAKVQGQMRSVVESSAAVEEIAKNIESLNGAVSKQASSISRASAAVEEMVGNIGSIGGVVEKMAAQFQTVNAAASEGTAIQQESRAKVQEIVEESKALQDANKIIATIAAQTNLLAMNAAIEAAHAGDAGRGFSVVADEIRKLAETSSRESQKISAELKHITETIDSVVKSTQASENAFVQVASRVGETEKLVQEVDNAIREQQEGAEQVLTALKDMNDISAEVKTGSKEMNEGNTAILEEMNKLQAASREISDNMEEMVKSAAHISRGAGEVASLAEGAQSTIGKISAVTDSFEV
jgi:methyl-accepting chemotaxis protein